MNVYVASPYDNAPFVREIVHERLRALDLTPTSRWAEFATGPENFSRSTATVIRRAAAQNDADLRASDVLLLIDLAGSGRETYAEVRAALEWGKVVVWLGRPALSAFRSGVVRVEDLDAAMCMLTDMRAKHAEGYRGQLLAHLCGVSS